MQDISTTNQSEELRQGGRTDYAEWKATFTRSSLGLGYNYRNFHWIRSGGVSAPGKSLGQLHGYGFYTTNHRREYVRINQDVHRVPRARLLHAPLSRVIAEGDRSEAEGFQLPEK